MRHNLEQEELTISCHRGALWGLVTQCFRGCFQLFFQSADVAVGLCPHDAELRVDVLVLVTGVLLVLEKKRAEQTVGTTRPGGLSHWGWNTSGA